MIKGVVWGVGVRDVARVRAVFVKHIGFRFQPKRQLLDLNRTLILLTQIYNKYAFK